VHGRKIAIAVPASVVSDIPHLREKTSRVATIGRAAAIFKIGEIIVYPDNLKFNQTSQVHLIALLLSYMETPQYLRKKLFNLEPDLRYAGILPPLRTAHHPLERTMKGLKVGEFREGVTVSTNRDGTLVDIGVERLAILQKQQLPIGKRITTKIRKVTAEVEVELANRDEIPDFWGYSVIKEDRPLGKILESGGFDLRIATSKYGIPFSDVARDMCERWRSAKSVILIFGAPNQGLHQIVRQENLELEEVADFIVNMIPSQGTETIRTEEAIIASLAILNASSSSSTLRDC